MFTEPNELYNVIARADAGDLPMSQNRTLTDDFCHHYPIHHRASKSLSERRSGNPLPTYSENRGFFPSPRR